MEEVVRWVNYSDERDTDHDVALTPDTVLLRP